MPSLETGAPLSSCCCQPQPPNDLLQAIGTRQHSTAAAAICTQHSCCSSVLAAVVKSSDVAITVATRAVRLLDKLLGGFTQTRADPGGHMHDTCPLCDCADAVEWCFDQDREGCGCESSGWAGQDFWKDDVEWFYDVTASQSLRTA